MSIKVSGTRVYQPGGTNASIAAVRSQSTAFARVPGVSTASGCLNKASGMGTRNGTNWHLIGGAASPGCDLWFTPTAGTQLVVFVAGSMAHTSTGTGTSGGWTQRQAPVNSATLSLFTKTAVGGDSLELTHNGSNYPMAWAFYELSAGMTYINSVSASASSDTFPTLASLPATPKFMYAAYCRGINIPATTAASATVPAPWVEDADLFAPAAATGGVYMHVSYQENLSDTTFTPVITPTFTSPPTVADRQKIVAAFTL